MADQIVLPLTSQMASTEPPIPWHQPFRHQDGPFSVLFFFSSSPTGRGELDRKFLLTFTLNCSVSIFLTPISIFFFKIDRETNGLIFCSFFSQTGPGDSI